MTSLPGLERERFTQKVPVKSERGPISHDSPAHYQQPLPNADPRKAAKNKDIAGMQSLHPALSRLQFQVSTYHSTGSHSVTAFDPQEGTHAGSLDWSPNHKRIPGHVDNLDVYREPGETNYRRQGVAQAMFDIARSHPDVEVTPQHSQNRTTMGEKVTRKVGGFVPPVHTANGTGRIATPDHPEWQMAQDYYRHTGKHALNERGEFSPPDGYTVDKTTNRLKRTGS